MWWIQKCCGQGLIDTRLDEGFVLVMLSRAGNYVIVACLPDNRDGGRVFMTSVVWRTNTFHPKNNTHCSHFAISCLLLTGYNHTLVGYLTDTGAMITPSAWEGQSLPHRQQSNSKKQTEKNIANISHRVSRELQHIEVWIDNRQLVTISNFKCFWQEFEMQLRYLIYLNLGQISLKCA